MNTVLNIKTCNYLLTSMIDIKKLVKIASENNIKALGIADNNMYGALEFYKECKGKGIKPIIGLEVIINEMKLILYAESYKGYQNLLMISSYDKLDLSLLNKYSSDILCVMPYKSNVLYNDLKVVYEDLFAGYENTLEEKQIKLNNKVFMREILCIQKEDETYLKYLHAIRDGVNVSLKNDIKDVSLLPLCNNDNDIISKLCNVEIKFHQNLLPTYPCDDSYECLKKKCILGLKKIFGSSVGKKYQERLKHELNIIKKMGFCDYFLIVSDYVNYAKGKGILVGPGRGSAAGSLVAYLLNITIVDPLKYDLLFERFLNPSRVTMPDIDVDFEDTRREEVIKYCIEKYGENNTAYIITFGTMKSKAAIRDVGRCMDIALNKIDLLCKNINASLSLKDNLNNPKISKILDMNKELKKVYLIAMKFENLKRHTSIHAAGIVISNHDLREVVPLQKKEFGSIICYDKDYLEELGLLKMDFLGLKNLNLIGNILKEIPNITFDDIPLDDSKAINIFTYVNTVGIFQFESEGMVNFLKKLKPNSFDEVAAALALFRPGPMKNIDLYIKRRNGLSNINYYHEDLKEILKPTYGIIIYQEQIMQIAAVLAGYSMSEADNLRRAMSKKKHDILLKEKDKFISQSISRGYDKSIANEVYELILKFAEYGFNKSHTIAYAMISYKMAYLKAHYPKIFMKNLLDSAINSEDKTKTYIYECKKFNVFVSGPDINISSDTYIYSNDALFFPFTNIKGIGINNVMNILNERKKGKFKDIFDFVQRCDVAFNILENLIITGCFDKLGYNRKTLIQNINVIKNYADIAGYLDNDSLKPEFDIEKEYDEEYIAEKEFELFGFYLSNHPIVKYKNNYNIISLNKLCDYFDKRINTVIYIEKIREIKTKNNETMAFITLSDEIASADAVIFPKQYKNIIISKGEVLQIDGKVEKRYDKYQIIINSIKKLK